MCRHVLCGVCHERTVLYFRECPVCCKEMSGPAHADHHHAQVGMSVVGRGVIPGEGERILPADKTELWEVV